MYYFVLVIMYLVLTSAYVGFSNRDSRKAFLLLNAEDFLFADLVYRFFSPYQRVEP